MFGLISKESNDQDRVDIGYSRAVSKKGSAVCPKDWLP